MQDMKPTFFERFFKQESSAGIMLMFAALAAIITANTPLLEYYIRLIHTPAGIAIGSFTIHKPLLLWINDGLMAVFFFLVGLELKREFLEGELSQRSNIILPALGALGGMALPAAIYIIININDPVALQGWAIPAATDIAFALGILALLGSTVPKSMKVFLTSVAIFDDIGAIVIIAFFYTSNISIAALAVALACLIILFTLNRLNTAKKSPYFLVGMVMWAALLKSGVHATLAGVILAMFIPNSINGIPNISPLKSLEHDLHSIVAFVILPIFAFSNSGINLEGVGMEQVLHSVPLGIALGLFLGKQAGVFVFCWIGIKLRLATLPEGMSWFSLYGIAALCGIGFTMSLFIGSLAFEETGVNFFFDERLGIILGSVSSGIIGYFMLNLALRKNQPHDRD
ncbi:MAG TPA: Na+/H+ antiporter NhaA [Spirochaetota bacterium]|nr:Na+/H+ antiporter NhaA [Spirochaetota bacterium]HPI89579.1 Na+/H+ antiporter NhaA [Spirochaetota bacterium]HPR49043.1 Na+/H+ antiporter NhaA [Spirochaetota bacterium]